MVDAAEKSQWKHKYRDLLTDLESREKQWQALDETLRSVASRLAIAAMGRDPSVDSQLDEILKSIRSNAPETRLRQQLQVLSGAVAAHENNLNAGQTLDLPEFVNNLQLAADIRKRLADNLENGTARARVLALRELAREVNRLISHTHSPALSPTPAKLANAPPSTAKQAVPTTNTVRKTTVPADAPAHTAAQGTPPNKTDQPSAPAKPAEAAKQPGEQPGSSNSTGASDPAPVIASLLARLIRHFGDIAALHETVQRLQRRLSEGVDESGWDDLLLELSAAINDVILSIEREKDELETFLEQVTRQLAEFEQWASWYEDDTRDRSHDSDQLDQGLGQQVHGLHQDIESSTELADLKKRVQVRLDAVADHLRVFREHEQHRRSEAEKRSTALKEEIDQLKATTTELTEKICDQESRLMLDTLTGVHTRYAYDQRLQEEFQRWQRHGQPLAYSIWDIDHFKSVNDSFGHEVGDQLLTIVAGMLLETTRVEDFVARIGGEEFVVLFPATTLGAAEALSNRLRSRIAESGFRNNNISIGVTVSCGLTDFRQGDTPQSVYKRADKALYEAKNSGRNRCYTN